MGWYNDKAEEVTGTDSIMARFRIAITRYERLIESFASRHDTHGKETLEDMYQLGVFELWQAVVEDRDEFDPRSSDFEKWFKTRLGHCMIDRVALYKPRRGPKKVVAEAPFTTRLRRNRREDTDLFMVTDGVVKTVMNIFQGDRDYAEGTCFEFISGDEPAIRWLTDDQPNPDALYYIEGTAEQTTWVAPSPGCRDPRLEVDMAPVGHDSRWDKLGLGDMGEDFNVNQHHLSPEERFLQAEAQQVFAMFMTRLTEVADAQSLQLMRALTRDNLSEGKGSPQRRLMKLLKWTGKDLATAGAKLAAHVQAVAADLRDDGYELHDIAKNFCLVRTT